LVYGRPSLAYAARCFAARAHNLPKDDCKYRCLDYPDGLLASTQKDRSFLMLNGIHTQAAQTYKPLPVFRDATGLGVDVLRISPQSAHTERVVELLPPPPEG
jgi:collagenase-like PrtC family protease